MNKPTIVAVDPGVNGGIAVFIPSEGTTELHKMPPTDWDVVNLIKSIHMNAGRVILYLEEPPLFAGKNIPGSAIGKLMWNTGVLYGSAVANGWEVHRVKPAIWMKAHPVGTKGERTSTQWKNVLKARACELFPDEEVTLWNADALLILDAAKRGAIN
jgi:hypothetical protein